MPLSDLVADPEFHQLPLDRQKAVATQLEPELAQLDPVAQSRVIFASGPEHFYKANEEKYGLAPGLLEATAMTESSGSPRNAQGGLVESPTGVRGLMQITGPTGARYGLDRNTPDFEDPLRQIDVAGQLHRDNFKSAGGDLRRAIAMYGDPNQADYADLVMGRLAKIKRGAPTKELQPVGAVEPPVAPEPMAPNPMDIIEQPGVPAGPQGVPWDSALRDTLGRQGESVGAGAMGLLKGLVTGQLSNPSYYTQGEGLENVEAMGPVIAGPAGAVGGIAAETAARARPDLSPVDPQTAATVGQLGPGVARLGLSGLRGAAKVLSPTLRAGEREAATLTARGLEQQAVEGVREGQVAARSAAGLEVPTVTQRIGGRLEAGAREATKRLEQTSAQTPTGLVDELGRPLITAEKDYATNLAALRQTSEKAAQEAEVFNKHVTRYLHRTDPKALAQNLSKDKDLQRALLTHATQTEAEVINKAVELGGKPLSQLPFTPEQLTALGREMQNPQSLLYRLVAGSLKHSAGAAAGGAVAGPVGAVALPLALKALDVALGSKPAVKLMLGLKTLTPGAPEVGSLLARVGAKVGGPQTLEPKSQPEGETTMLATRAEGGPLKANQPALVGEQGPELSVPDRLIKGPTGLPEALQGPTGLAFRAKGGKTATELVGTFDAPGGYINAPLLVPGQQNVKALLKGRPPTKDQINRGIAWARQQGAPIFPNLTGALMDEYARHGLLEQF